MSFGPLDWDILISKFQKKSWSFSNYPSLKALEEQNGGNMQNTLKLMIFKSQYCFANISAMKAPIFMKFEATIHKVVKNYQNIFCKVLCPHTCTRGINMRTRVFSRQNQHSHVYASCARVCTRIVTKKFDDSLKSYE